MTFVLLVDRDRREEKTHVRTERKSVATLLLPVVVFSGANRCFLMLSSFFVRSSVRALSFIDMISTFFPPFCIHLMCVRMWKKTSKRRRRRARKESRKFSRPLNEPSVVSSVEIRSSTRLSSSLPPRLFSSLSQLNITFVVMLTLFFSLSLSDSINAIHLRSIRTFQSRDAFSSIVRLVFPLSLFQDLNRNHGHGNGRRLFKRKRFEWDNWHGLDCNSIICCEENWYRRRSRLQWSFSSIAISWTSGSSSIEYVLPAHHFFEWQWCSRCHGEYNNIDVFSKQKRRRPTTQIGSTCLRSGNKNRKSPEKEICGTAVFLFSDLDWNTSRWACFGQRRQWPPWCQSSIAHNWC